MANNMRSVRNDITREADNIVRFDSGEKIEFYTSRLTITAKDGTASLELRMRPTDEYHDTNGTPSFREIFWPANPTWSDGSSLDPIELRRVGELIKQAAAFQGLLIKQDFLKANFEVDNPDDFNTF
jgi:hypothetical protein